MLLHCTSDILSARITTCEKKKNKKMKTKYGVHVFFMKTRGEKYHVQKYAVNIQMETPVVI